MKIIGLRDNSPLVTFKIVFRTGSAQDPQGKGGSAWLTALMLASASPRKPSVAME